MCFFFLPPPLFSLFTYQFQTTTFVYKEPAWLVCSGHFSHAITAAHIVAGSCSYFFIRVGLLNPNVCLIPGLLLYPQALCAKPLINQLVLKPGIFGKRLKNYCWYSGDEYGKAQMPTSEFGLAKKNLSLAFKEASGNRLLVFRYLFFTNVTNSWSREA